MYNGVKKEVKNANRVGMSVLSQCSRYVAGNISSCGMVAGVEGCSPCGGQPGIATWFGS